MTQRTLKLKPEQIVIPVRNAGIPDWIGEYGLLAFWLLCILKAIQWAFLTSVILAEVAYYEMAGFVLWWSEKLDNPNIELWSVLVWYTLAGSVVVYAFEAWRQDKWE